MAESIKRGAKLIKRLMQQKEESVVDKKEGEIDKKMAESIKRGAKLIKRLMQQKEELELIKKRQSFSDNLIY